MKPDCPIRFEGIDHIVLQVSDKDRSLHFYTEVLGLSLERIIEDLQIYQLRCGRSIVDLRVLPADKTLADKDVRGVDHVCLMLHGDFDAVVDYLRANAVPIVMGPVELYGATGYGSSVYVTDPDGHTLELKADHAQYPVRTTARQAMGSVSRPKQAA